MSEAIDQSGALDGVARLSRTDSVGPGSVEVPVDVVAEHSTPGYGSDLMLDAVRAIGCRFIPMNPGSSFRGFHDSIINYGGNRDPQMLLCHDEGIAVAMAHGYAKSTRSIGVAVIHDLVGLMQASMGVFNAYMDEVPMLLLGGGGPADTRQRRPLDWAHSASAQAELVRSFVKWDAEPIDVDATRRAILQAARIAQTPPKGPTYVTLDAHAQELPLDGPALETPESLDPGIGFSVDERTAEKILRLLIEAERPLIITGTMGYDPAATRAITAIGRAVGAACVDADHASVVPTAFELNLTGDKSALAEADVVLAFGIRDLRSLAEPVKGRRWGQYEPAALSSARIIDVGLRDLWIRPWADGGATAPACEMRVAADPTRAAAVIADVARTLSGVSADVTRRRDERIARLTDRREKLHAAGREKVRARWDDPSIHVGRVVAELWDAVKEDPWQMVLRNSRSFPIGCWQYSDASDYLGHSGGAGVGYGPGAAVGGALGAWEQGRLGVGIIGDGDLLNSPGAIWTAVGYRIPLLLVVNDNESFHNDEQHQFIVAEDRGRPVENSWIGMRMEDPKVDIAALAKGYGAWSAGPIEDGADLSRAIKDGAEVARGGGVAVVHVRTSRD